MSAKRRVWPWVELDLEGPVPLREVKRAYSVRLKAIDRNDPDQFQRLQGAFEAAKRSASADEAPAAPLRPTISALTRGYETPSRPAPEAAPFRFAPKAERIVPAKADVPPPPPPLEVAEAVEPPPEAKEEPAPKHEAPKPAGVKPAAPWGVRTDDLDRFNSEDPEAARRSFWTKFDAASQWPWSMQTLEMLLSLEMVQSDIFLKRDIERRLFNNVSENVIDQKGRIPRACFDLLEAHFEWGTDGVGLHRRFGRHRNYQLLVHALDLARPHPTVVGTLDADSRNYRWLKVGILALLWLVSLGTWDKALDANEVFVSLIATSILFFAVLYALLFLTAVVVEPVKAFGFHMPLVNAFRWAFPGLTSDLIRAPKFRAFSRWTIAAVIVFVLMVIR